MNHKQRHGYSREIVDRLLELGRLAYGNLPSAPSLTRSQWGALRYFARANEYSRTASAFCSFHAITPGTASETISSLVRLGLLQRVWSKVDRRIAHLELTERGTEVLRADPAASLERALQELPQEQLSAVAAGLTALAAKLALEQHRPVFGACDQCKYFEAGGTATGSPQQGCRWFKVPLSPDGAAELCVGFEGRELLADGLVKN